MKRSTYPLYFFLLGILISYFLKEGYSYYTYFYDLNSSDKTLCVVLFLVGGLSGITFKDKITQIRLPFYLFYFLSTFYVLEFCYYLLSFSSYAHFPIYFQLILSGIGLSMLFRMPPKHTFALLFGVLLVLFASFSKLEIFIFSAIGSVFILVASNKAKINWGFSALCLIPFLFPLTPVSYFSDQHLYHDKIISQFTTRFSQIDITEWKGDRWFYFNHRPYFSTIDYSMYYEPMAHLPLRLIENPEKILVIGGENGILIHQILKHESVQSVTFLPYDSSLFRIASTESEFLTINHSIFDNEKIKVISNSIFDYLAFENTSFDLIYIDLPDPSSIETSQYFSKEFYQLLKNHLTPDGIFITQSMSPYLTPNSFQTIKNTIISAGFQIQPMHNQIPTIGEWSWVMGALDSIKFSDFQFEKAEQLNTKWLTPESTRLLLSFGKSPNSDYAINTIDSAILFKLNINETAFH